MCWTSRTGGSSCELYVLSFRLLPPRPFHLSILIYGSSMGFKTCTLFWGARGSPSQGTAATTFTPLPYQDRLKPISSSSDAVLTPFSTVTPQSCHSVRVEFDAGWGRETGDGNRSRRRERKRPQTERRLATARSCERRTTERRPATVRHVAVALPPQPLSHPLSSKPLCSGWRLGLLGPFLLTLNALFAPRTLCSPPPHPISLATVES
jgi:hypothetical protein